MKKSFAFAVLSTTMLASMSEARQHHNSAPAPAPEPAPMPQSHHQADPFASLGNQIEQAAPRQSSRGGGGSMGSQYGQHQSHQQQPAAPVEPPKKQKKDDGADQDDENDPEWYRTHATSYPCYKLAEQGLFNFQQMRNLDGDWQVSDNRGRQVSFNFCIYAESKSDGCENDSFAFMKQGGKCLELTSDEPQAEVNEFIERPNPGSAGQDQEGIRINRAGGGTCPEDSNQLMSVTIDVWCNLDVTGSPEKMTASDKGPLEDDDTDPCSVYIEMEHADGCVVFDLHPFLVVLGCFMILFGICLQYMGPEWQQSFMVFIVRLGTFLIVIAFMYEKNYFAFFDPSEPPEKKDPVKAFMGLIFAFVLQWIVGWLFRYSIRIAPTLLGIYVGYYFAIYIVIAVNGVGGAFTTAKTAHDTIDPIMSMVYEGFGAFIGGILGYCYSAAFIACVQTFISAYLIVRGTTLFKNMGWPNEIVLMSSTTTENNNLVKLPPGFYVYSFCILVLWIIFLRSHMRRRDQQPNNGKYLDEEQQNN